MGHGAAEVKVLVTGGGGFLGGAIVRRLIERGHSVRTLARGEYPALSASGVETMQGDIANYAAVEAAVRGCEAIVHTAAKAGAWGPYLEYYDTNVIGTQNVINACKRCEVTRLVYTSTPSVAFAGADQEGVTEAAPYPENFLAAYPRTKAVAEQLVLAANGERLGTIALRPHLIWGPGDTQLGPRIVEGARAGRLRIVGSGRQQVDATYIDNAAHAHVLAVDRIAPGAACGGKAYYITNGEPWPIADIMNGIIEAAGAPPVTKHISPGVAYAAGVACETIYTLLRKRNEPPMTRFVARQLGTAHWYDISAAQQDLGYAPIVSMKEGLERLRAANQAAQD